MDNFVANEKYVVKNLADKLEIMTYYKPKTSWKNIAENLHKDFKDFLMENSDTFIGNQEEYETKLFWRAFRLTSLEYYDK